MLRLEDVHAQYGAIVALHGVSIDVREGELVALVGANGAGKSTLLSTIAGVLRPHQGRIEFRGESLVGLVPERIVRRGLAMVPENREIFPALTVEENLRLGAYIRKDRDEFQADLEHMFALFPILQERFAQPAGTLSGGEQQQLAIARALMSHPDLLMLDEPSLGRHDHPAGRAERLADPQDRGPRLRPQHGGGPGRGNARGAARER
jgi:branched-chain amino acid transport system ATP-binding protein